MIKRTVTDSNRSAVSDCSDVCRTLIVREAKVIQKNARRQQEGFNCCKETRVLIIRRVVEEGIFIR